MYITHTSSRIKVDELETNEEDMRLALNLIDEVRDGANSMIVEYQKKAFFTTV